MFATSTLRGSRAAFALKEKKDDEEKASNRKPCEKSSDQVQRVMDCCNRHCIGEDRDQPCADHLKNESAQTPVRVTALVRTALHRSLLTTSLRSDLHCGNGSSVLAVGSIAHYNRGDWMNFAPSVVFILFDTLYFPATGSTMLDGASFERYTLCVAFS